MFVKNTETIYELTIRQNHPYRGVFQTSKLTEEIHLYFKTEEQAKYYRDHNYPGRDTDMQARIAYESDGQWVIMHSGIKSKPSFGRGEPASLQQNHLYFPPAQVANITKEEKDWMEGLSYSLSSQLNKQLKQCNNNSLVGIVIKEEGFGCAGPGLYRIDADLANTLSDANKFLYKDNAGEYYLVKLSHHYCKLVPEAECEPDKIKYLESRLQQLAAEQEMLTQELEKLRAANKMTA